MKHLVSVLRSPGCAYTGKPLKAVIFDLDGTLTPVRSVWQYIHERLGTWESQGLQSLNAFLAGKITYKEFAERDVYAWRGTPHAIIESIVNEIPLRNGAREVAGTLRAFGVRTAILSSGLDVLVRRVAGLLGVERYIANELGFTAGVADGRVTINVGWDGKPEHLLPLCRAWGVHPSEVAVVGDGVGDAPLFPMVGLGVAFNAAPDVASEAHLALEGDDLRVLLPVLFGRMKGETAGGMANRRG
ncbi:HAD family hydrolase [Desulforudis sp. DRI-14]|uniref:HAD family hydrolase n=1 Tax=Desulforudis sp. DRI-14 TaxID=3459793 RepID=UPI004042971E